MPDSMTRDPEIRAILEVFEKAVDEKIKNSSHRVDDNTLLKVRVVALGFSALIMCFDKAVSALKSLKSGGDRGY